MAGKSSLSTGNKIRLDGKYAGYVRFKGPLDGRKGDWLGLEMDDTVGDNDGSLNGKHYFRTHDGQGIFLREDSGRCTEVAAGAAKIPEEMLEHMKFLFASFDIDHSGDINQEELYQAMQHLGQKGTRKHVAHIFEEIDMDKNGTIDFHEFIEVMQVQWKGIDLGRAVQMIKLQEEEEARANQEVDLAPVEVLYANLFGFQLHLKYFGSGMNGFLLFVYGILALAATWYLLLEVPADLFNKLLVISLGGMSALFAIGGLSIHQHRWVTIKVYAVVMFFGAGAQFTMCLLYYFDFFAVSGATVKIVMDKKCGTCLGDSSECNQVSMTGSLIGDAEIDYTDLPWYCCCALNECFDFSTVVTKQASCEDGCDRADLGPDPPDLATSTETDARNQCLLTVGAGYAADPARGFPNDPCTYVGYVAPSDASCTCIGSACGDNDLCLFFDASGRDADNLRAECSNLGGGGQCQFTERVRKVRRKCEATNTVACHNFRSSNSTCHTQGTCTYLPAEYGATADLNDDMTKANAFCTASPDFTGHAALAIEGQTSRLGNDRCFVEEAGDGILAAKGSMAKCVEEYQAESQEIYIIFINVLLPLQLVAAYVGWVLPDLYFKAHHESKENDAMDAHADAAADAAADAFAQEPDTSENPVAGGESESK